VAKRKKKVDSRQVVFLWESPPKIPKAKPPPAKRTYRAGSFYGAVVPRPTDKDGNEIDNGPLGVYLRTDCVFVVLDRRRKLGDWTVAAHLTFEGAMRSFKRLSARL
jgi:hypothetical protein